ncbi:plasmid pRiA4b ORF-3 family protein, partial [Rhizobium sp. BUS002]|nr:plasmid pRiA4b ORF-3 family protein [Rhizobium phaseoli]
IIQTAMGWKNAHMHAFTLGAVRYTIPDPDWPSRVETRDERVFDLAAVLADGTTEFIYTYDFGDDWRHRIHVEAAMESGEKNSRPLCVA